MPEEIDAPLNWPDTGLAGVPASDNGLAPSAPAAAAAGAAEMSNGAGGNGVGAGSGSGEGADGGAGGGAGGGADGGADGGAGGGEGSAPAQSLYDPALEESVAAISRDLHELSAAAAAAQAGAVDPEVAATLHEAKETLHRLEAAAAEVSSKLEEINEVLEERADDLNAELAFGSNILTEEDPALVALTEFKGGLPGITTASGVGSPHASGGAVTWPPWAPPRKASLWSRFTRSAIAIPLLLLAVIAVGAATYKIVHSRETAPPAAGNVTASGSVKVVDGPKCIAGSATATIELAGAQGANGDYAISATGTLDNGGSQQLSHVVVQWAVTYADGYTSTETAPVNTGNPVPGKTTKTWFAVGTHSEGTVPPATVRIVSLVAQPALPACA